MRNIHVRMGNIHVYIRIDKLIHFFHVLIIQFHIIILDNLTFYIRTIVYEKEVIVFKLKSFKIL